ncbi:MAG: cytochrome c1 [Pseudomonadota bacterium]
MKFVKTLVATGLALAVGITAASAAAYPKNKPREQDWTFAGPFGKYDRAQLQRGFKVYQENCSACHGLQRVSFRNLSDLGFNDDQIKELASQYEVEDGPNEFGEMFMRPANAADQFPWIFQNREEAVSALGAYPPDMSLLAKARHVERGFPTFVFDIFTQYAEAGPDYIYSLLTGYKEPPEGSNIPDTLYYNPYFVAGEALAMAQPIYDDGIEYDDGTPATMDQQARDVAAFLMWAAEPKLEQRKETGFRVMVFLIIFAAFLYMSKKQVWSRIEH